MKEIKGQRQHWNSAFLYVLALLTFTVQGCSSRPTYERLREKQDRNNARGAAYAADGFTMDHRSPEPRPYQPWEFYYKHCTLVSRNPFPSRAEYSCTDPY